MSAAIRVVASEGLSAATATIARQAEVSNGSLFTYFETKADLFNRLYTELKAEMAAAALDGLPTGSGIQEQMRHMWSGWLHWATTAPDKRRTLALLETCDDITPASRLAASRTMSGVASLLERSRETGPMRDAPLGLVVGLMSALADATVDYMIREPTDADRHSRSAFGALWRIVA